MTESTSPDEDTEQNGDARAQRRGDETETLASGPRRVVALGASAGGLDALARFFSAVPADSGLAFVVVQHLAPSPDSVLPELLRRSSAIEVVTAENDMRLEPDRAHVLPPGAMLSIERDELHVLDSPASPRRLPIDHFLRALASEHREQAVAIILSGTGTDGTLGCQAIKAEGGLVLAQEPATAEHAGMPQSAIDAGVVDLTLPPADMPKRLIEHALHPRPVPPDSEDDAQPQTHDLQQILSRLRGRRGHDLSMYKTSTVVRRVGRRMAVNCVATYGDYIRLIDERPDELDALFSELLIRVSGFFRDSEAFESLTKNVIPELFKNRSHSDPVRVWVPGCSTGEEAYSIAILLQEWLEQFRRRQPVQVFATDIDSEAVRIAREGRYPANIAADVTQERLARFFNAAEQHYEVTKSLREMVVFAEQSLVQDPPFSRLSLVSCRNVLIYMGSELQRQVLPLFHYALEPGGYLFLGISESVGGYNDLFVDVDRSAKIFRRQASSASNLRQQNLPRFLKPRRDNPLAEVAPAEEQDQPSTEKRVQLLLMREFTPACVLVNDRDEILYFHGNTSIFLEPEKGQPSVDIMRKVRPHMASQLRRVIQQARVRDGLVHGDTLHIEFGGETRPMRFAARPFEERGFPRGSLIVLVESMEAGTNEAQAPDRSAETHNERIVALEWELANKEQALQATIEELETSNEELQSSNEELQSSNEELQSTNEELETSREELQALNEELQTVNSELESKVEELARARDDLNNLLTSSAIGIIFLDDQLCVQRYTAAVTDIIPLIDSDGGRPIGDFSHRLESQQLTGDLEEVLRTNTTREHELRGQNGRWYLTRMSPYRVSGNQTHGVVVTFIDLTGNERSALASQLATALGQCPMMVVVADTEGRLVYVNDVFTRQSGHDETALIGESASAAGLACLGDPEHPAMRSARGDGNWRGEVTYQCRDGTEVRVAASIAPLRPAGAAITHVVAYLDVPQ